MIFCFIILYTSLLLFTGRESHLVFLLYYLIIPGNILLSYWFFLGMEEMHFLNIPNIISRLGYTIFIFVFLKQENQFYLVPLFYGTFLIAGGLVSLLIIFFRYKIKFAIPSLRVLIDYLKEGWSIFISTFAINLYRKSNVFILGLVAPKEAVGFYSAGEKIIIAIQSVFNPIIQAFYPFVSRRKSISIRRGLKDISFLLRSVGTSGLLVAIFFILFSGKLTILFLGKEFSPTIPVLRLGGLVICIGVLNYILGIIFMTNFGFKKEFATRVMITGIFNLIFCFVMSYLFQEIGAAVSFLVAEVVLFLLLIIFTLRNKSKWSPEFV